MPKVPEVKYVTAKELREFLAKVPDDTRIYRSDDYVGYIGSISWLRGATYQQSIFPDDNTPPDGVELEFL